MHCRALELISSNRQRASPAVSLLSHRASISRSAFMGRRTAAVSVASSKSSVRMQQLPVFTRAMDDFKNEYPDFAKRGWGATVKAEVRF